MRKISQRAQRLFKKWGQSGGKRRAQNLSSDERSIIAARAARARWDKSMPSVRLKSTELNDPVYIEEILSDGTWENWRRLYQIILNYPFGNTSVMVEKVCSSVKMYGVSTLWQGILHLVRGGVS